MLLVFFFYFLALERDQKTPKKKNYCSAFQELCYETTASNSFEEKKSPFKRKQKQARNVGMQLGRQMRSIATRQTCFPTTSIPMLNASF
jgi:hypothetical protein